MHCLGRRWQRGEYERIDMGAEQSQAPIAWIRFYFCYPPRPILAGLNPGAIPFGGPSDMEVPAFTAAIKAHQKRITDDILDHALGICSKLNSTKLMRVNVKTHVVVGDPKEKICEAVQNSHADLLVMGSRAFGPIKRMFLGSVSNYCTHHA